MLQVATRKENIFSVQGWMVVSNCYQTQHNSLRHGPHIFRNLLNLQIHMHEGLQEMQLKLVTLASESHQKEKLFFDIPFTID